jgi:hypothetical protein
VQDHRHEAHRDIRELAPGTIDKGLIKTFLYYRTLHQNLLHHSVESIIAVHPGQGKNMAI